MKFGFAVLLLLFSVIARADFQVPALTGPVVDDASILSPQTARGLSRGLRALHERGGSQITVLTVPSLEGISIEEAGIRTLDKWKLGGEKTDNGVILLIAPKERKLRIEVGQGLEGQLTDADSKRIIAEEITPLFKSGDYNSGVLVGVFKIVSKTDPDFDIRPYLQGHAEREMPQREGLPRLWVFLGLLFLLFFLGRGGGFGSGLLLGSILSSGRSGASDWGGGWGGGGGGGWSGGGGSGSGGGASGDW